jgi:hypothetical protein
VQHAALFDRHRLGEFDLVFGQFTHFSFLKKKGPATKAS